MRISEIFVSIQGEGVWMGQPMVFVRTAGCNLRCKWCDTPYALDPESGEEMSVEEVLERIWALDGAVLGHVCVTGGEPLIQKDIYKLLYALLDRNMHVVLETNGSIPVRELPCEELLTTSMDIKTPSSGMAHMSHPEYIEDLGPKDQVKFIIADEEDYEYAINVLDEHPPPCPVIFTPVGGVDLRWLAEKAVEDRLGGVRVLPQLHKIIWGEERGR